MKLAGLSVDVDSVASHLEGYGFERPPDDGAAYRIAIPRALELFEKVGARATFFLIASEAEANAEAVREISSRGHEVASHSMTHGLPFADLSEERSRSEIVESKALLEKISGQLVEGFRAPSWDTDPDLVARLGRAGYRYDASAYPSVLLPLLRRSIAARSANGSVRTRSGLWDGVFGPTGVHTITSGESTIYEIPVATTPFVRLPHYHTLRYVLPEPVFRAIGVAARSRRGPTTYQFHAVDFLCTEEDRLDERIARHPGMNVALPRKLALAEESLRALSGSRRVVPLRDIINSVDGARSGRRTPKTLRFEN